MLKNSTSKSGHRRARSWGGWLRAATVLAGVALASTAHAVVDAGTTIPGAQSGTVTVTTPMRSSTLRQTATKQHWISHKDCLDDIQLTFTTTVTAPTPGKKLIAYVSKSVDDCLQNSTRNDPARCRHLQVVQGTESSATPLVTVKAKALTELMSVPACGDDAGTSTAPVSLKLYFFLSPPAEDLIQGTANFAIFADSGIDLWGPAPPTDLVVTPGDEELQISFASGLDTSGDQAGLFFFIDDGSGVAGVPTTATTSGGSTSASAASSGAASSTSAASSATATSGAGGASTSTGAGGAGGASTSATSATSAGSTSAATSTATGAGAGGAGAGPNLSTGVTGSGNVDACNPTATVAKCTAGSFVLIPGEVPNNTGTGQTLTTGTKGTITGLTNGVAVVVALAAFDDVGNVGKLSELQCGTPAPVNSFLRVYECKGGLKDSGCGFCSMSGERTNSFAALASGGLVVLGLLARRSRRPRVTGSSRGAR